MKEEDRSKFWELVVGKIHSENDLETFELNELLSKVENHRCIN